MARHARARLLEVDAETIADLAEDLLRVAAGLAASAHVPAPSDLGPGPVPGGRPRILLAEDDVDEREAIAAGLEGDYELVHRRRREPRARLGPPGRPRPVVLTDLELPALDGFGPACAALSLEPRTADTPVIVLSAHAADRLKRVRALDLGAVDYLVKPVSREELRARLERSVRLAQRRDALQSPQAQTDALTGLPNYRAFLARLGEEVKRAYRYGAPLACLMMDLDHFKAINDRLGPRGREPGARCLRGGARGASVRETDFAARYGGDEFVVLLPHASEGEAAATRRANRRAARHHRARRRRPEGLAPDLLRRGRAGAGGRPGRRRRPGAARRRGALRGQAVRPRPRRASRAGRPSA